MYGVVPSDLPESTDIEADPSAESLGGEVDVDTGFLSSERMSGVHGGRNGFCRRSISAVSIRGVLTTVASHPCWPCVDQSTFGCEGGARTGIIGKGDALLFGACC